MAFEVSQKPADLQELLKFEDFRDAERAVNAAQNARLPLLKGIQALGKLMVVGADADVMRTHGPEEWLEDIGYLLSELGDQIEFLCTIESNARFEQTAAGKKLMAEIGERHARRV